MHILSGTLRSITVPHRWSTDQSPQPPECWCIHFHWRVLSFFQFFPLLRLLLASMENKGNEGINQLDCPRCIRPFNDNSQQLSQQQHQSGSLFSYHLNVSLTLLPAQLAIINVLTAISLTVLSIKIDCGLDWFCLPNSGDLYYAFSNLWYRTNTVTGNLQHRHKCFVYQSTWSGVN